MNLSIKTYHCHRCPLGSDEFRSTILKYLIPDFYSFVKGGKEGPDNRNKVKKTKLGFGQLRGGSRSKPV